MDRIVIVNGITLLESCQKYGTSFKAALELARSHKIYSLIHEGKRWVSPALDIKTAVIANQDFIRKEKRLFRDGRSY